MKWPWTRENATETPENDTDIADVLLKALFGEDKITKKQALAIPGVQACVDMIAETVSSLPIKLYKKADKGVEEIQGDLRVRLLNTETGDTLTATQFWRAMIEDYYLEKGGYAYLRRWLMDVVGIHYVEPDYISILKNEDPIFKDYEIYCYDKKYMPFDFLKILRKSKDGSSSVSIIEENQLIFGVLYHELVYEKNMVQKGGNKRGFIKSQAKLSEPAMAALKEAYRRLYSNNSENVVILNNGLEFQEASNTSVEMQLNENKLTNENIIAALFHIPLHLLKGAATHIDVDNYIKFCITPLLNDIECSLDRDLLREDEKVEDYYFAFDTRELTRGNIKERYEAYEIGLRNNFLQPDEVREKEDMEPLGFNWIRLGLDSVLYDPKTGIIYTPNTKEMGRMEENGEVAPVQPSESEEKDESGTES